MALVSPNAVSQSAIDSDGHPSSESLLIPHPDSFERFPQFWHFACASRALRPGGLKAVATAGERLVVYRGASGAAAAVAARCPHLGSDLARGRVIDEMLECPYHRFRFDAAGRCAEHGLRTRAFAVEERYGAIFVCSSPRPPFPLPVFEDDADLVSARPFRHRLEAPWFMVGANAFDARHFGAAHDRRLLAPPVLTRLGPRALHVHYTYEIRGAVWIDRAVRRVSGARVEFDVTSFCGNVLLVRARFRRDASYGFVVVQPARADGSSTDVTVIVNAARGDRLAARATIGLRLFAKRLAIGRMLLDDVSSLRRLDYVHDGLKPGDEVIAAYLRWVRLATRGAGDAPSGRIHS